MTFPSIRIVVLIALGLLSLNAHAWQASRTVLFTSSEARGSATVISPASESDEYDWSNVQVSLKEEGTHIGGDSDTCQRAYSTSDMICWVVVVDSSLTSGCEYCAYNGYASVWDPDSDSTTIAELCKTYNGPGGGGGPPGQ